MSDFTAYMGSVMARTGITSHRGLAARLGVSQTHVSNMLSGLVMPSDDLCVKLAQLAGDDPAGVILISHKAKSSALARPVWEKIIKALSAAALVFVLFLHIAFGAMSHNPDAVYYVKLIVIGAFLLYERSLSKNQAA